VTVFKIYRLDDRTIKRARIVCGRSIVQIPGRHNSSPPLQHLCKWLCCLGAMTQKGHRKLVTHFGVIQRV